MSTVSGIVCSVSFLLQDWGALLKDENIRTVGYRVGTVSGILFVVMLRGWGALF